MSIEKHRAFINSLEGEKGLPEEMLRAKFERHYATLPLGRQGGVNSGDYCDPLIRYLWTGFKAGAESRQIPDLKERVKELMRDAMSAAQTFEEYGVGYQCENLKRLVEFQKMCEPEKSRGPHA